jgi:hypothetical protein
MGHVLLSALLSIQRLSVELCPYAYGTPSRTAITLYYHTNHFDYVTKPPHRNALSSNLCRISSAVGGARGLNETPAVSRRRPA